MVCRVLRVSMIAVVWIGGGASVLALDTFPPFTTSAIQLAVPVSVSGCIPDPEHTDGDVIRYELDGQLLNAGQGELQTTAGGFSGTTDRTTPWKVLTELLAAYQARDYQKFLSLHTAAAQAYIQDLFPDAAAVDGFFDNVAGLTAMTVRIGYEYADGYVAQVEVPDQNAVWPYFFLTDGAGHFQLSNFDDDQPMNWNIGLFCKFSPLPPATPTVTGPVPILDLDDVQIMTVTLNQAGNWLAFFNSDGDGPALLIVQDNGNGDLNPAPGVVDAELDGRRFGTGVFPLAIVETNYPAAKVSLALLAAAVGTVLEVQEAPAPDGFVYVPFAADTYVTDEMPNTNEGGSPMLQLAGNNRVLLKVDQQALTDAIGDGTLVGAAIELNVAENDNAWPDVTRSAQLLAAADTFVKQQAPADNEGASPVLQLAGQDKILVRFSRGSIEATVGNAAVVRVQLQLQIVENVDDWDANGADVGAHLLSVDWREGNGNIVAADGEAARGTGAGATWDCAQDANVGNQSDDCTAAQQWLLDDASGASPWTATASALSTLANGQRGAVTWDVTADFHAFQSAPSANLGWVIRKAAAEPGTVRFGSRESAAQPRLIFELAEPGGILSLHLLNVDWLEGNGLVAGIPAGQQSTGNGGGATWACAHDADISNDAVDCAGASAWAMPLDAGSNPWQAGASRRLVIQSGQAGTVWADVTTDVILMQQGLIDNFGWLLRKEEEAAPGAALFWSRSSAGAGRLRLDVRPVP